MLLPKILRICGKRTEKGCLEFTGNVNSETGYGQMRFLGETRSVHRVAALFYGIIQRIDSPFLVLHSCDNKICFEEKHLRAGTQRENIKECIEKGRFGSKKSKYCRRGHLLFGDNLGKYKKQRTCKICANRRLRKHRSK